MNSQILDDDEIIHQNHERGPGWFLRIAYIVIALSCIYYFFQYRDWKSNYQLQQEQQDQQLHK